MMGAKVEDRVAGTGSAVSLPCSLLRRPDAPHRFSLEWLKDGTVVYTLTSWPHNPTQGPSAQGSPALHYRGRASHGEDGSLRLSGIRSSDAGTYYCILKTFERPTAHPKEDSVHIRLQVQTQPFFVDEEDAEDEVWKNAGETLSLSCQADGIPPPHVSWTKNGWSVGSLERVSVSSGGYRLAVRGLREGDEGDYACTASNPLGTITRTTRVAFPKAAWLDLVPENVTALEGSAVLWRCHAQAEPAGSALRYRWFAGETEVAYAHLGLRARLLGSDLRIESVERADGGWYRCEAWNGHGDPASAAAYLDIHYEAEISRRTPAIQHLPLGLPASVNCIVDANPPASFVNWAKDGLVLDTRSAESRHTTEDNGATLSFQNVEKDDAGVYTCQAYNSVGGSNPYEVHILVQEPPYFVTEPPGTTTKESGDSVSLDCAGGGRPEPKVFWQRPGGVALPVEATQRTLNGTQRLSIPNLRPSHHGYYQCVVQNKVTSITRNALVRVRNTAPQAPSDLSVDSGAFDARISWKAGYDGGRPPQQFTLLYRQANSGNWRRQDAGNKTECTIAFLHPDVLYEFQVEPRNNLGPGFRTPLLQVRTLGYDGIGKTLPTDSTGEVYFPALKRPIGPRPGPPRNLELVSTPSAGLELAWEAPKSTAVPVYFYAVEYKPNLRSTINSSPDKEAKEETDSDGYRPLLGKVKDTRIKLGPDMYDLKSGFTYDLRVRSHSLAAFSLPSASIAYTVPGAGMQTALMAGLIGGVAFAFLAFFLLCLCLARRSSAKLKATDTTAAYSKAALDSSSEAGFTDSRFHAYPITKNVGNGDANVRCKRVSSLMPLFLRRSRPSLRIQKSKSGPAISLAGPPIRQFRSAGLSESGEEVLPRDRPSEPTAPYFSITDARYRSQRSSFHQPRLNTVSDLLRHCSPGPSVHEGVVTSPSSSIYEVADGHRRPPHPASPEHSPYNRDRLLSTIAKLRESRSRLRGGAGGSEESGIVGSSCLLPPPPSCPETGNGGPSPSASSTSGVSSESATGNALNTALAERFVARVGEEERISRLKTELRRARATDPPLASPPPPLLATTRHTAIL